MDTNKEEDWGVEKSEEKTQSFPILTDDDVNDMATAIEKQDIETIAFWMFLKISDYFKYDTATTTIKGKEFQDYVLNNVPETYKDLKSISSNDLKATLQKMLNENIVFMRVDHTLKNLEQKKDDHHPTPQIIHFHNNTS